MRRMLAAVALVALAIASTAGAAERPKLSVKKVSNPPASATAADTFAVTGKVKNRGKRTGKGIVRITLRSNPAADAAAEIARTRVRVPAKSTKRFATTARIPSGAGAPSPDYAQYLAPGDYFLVACIKRHGKTGNDRCRASTSTVTIKAQDTPPQPTFTPGARSLGDPIFPQIGNGGYDAEHYEIDLDYDPAANVFNSARTTITARATQNLSEFSFDFQELDVSAVRVNGAPAQFDFAGPSEPLGDPSAGVTQPTKLVVTPAQGILSATTFTVEVDYAGEPALITDADTSWEGWIPACYPLAPPQTCDGAFVVNEPIGAQGWFPSNNYPTDKATFDTIVTVPETHIALGIGELAAETDNGDGTTTWSWTEDDPSATYLTTATVGLFNETRSTMTETLTGDALDVYDYIDSSATPDQVTAIQTNTARQPSMLNFLGTEVFNRPYPFDSIGTVADRAAGVGYALEVQTKTHYAGGFSTGNPSVSVNTLLHEVGHQWMGNSVSPASWREIWFNEGWATWLTWHWDFQENADPVSPAQQLENNYAAADDADWEQPPALIDDPAELFHTFPVYTRGAMLLEAYRQIVGDERFFEFAGALLDAHGYSNISTSQFISLAAEMSGFTGSKLALLDVFFEQWLYGTTRPTLLPDDFN